MRQFHVQRGMIYSPAWQHFRTWVSLLSIMDVLEGKGERAKDKHEIVIDRNGRGREERKTKWLRARDQCSSYL